MNARQLALSIQLNNEATFADFCWGQNSLLEKQLYQTLEGEDPRIVYLWSTPGNGKSHLLQACCQAAAQLERSAIYLPLITLKEWGTSILDDLDTQALICMDDLETIAGDKAWEEAIFHLFNRIKDNEKTSLIFASHYAPRHIPMTLPDLKSRLSWGLVAQIQALSDEDKIQTLYLHAKKRGFELPINAAQFLVTRCARNMHDLHTLLNRLDEASLIAQRKLTIPFIKQWLAL